MSSAPKNEPSEGSADAASVTRSAGIVALGTLVSRVLGAVRDMVIAATFSVAATDAFFVAFTIPNALRGLLAEGAVSSAVIPLYTDARAKEGQARAKEVHQILAGALLLVLAVVSALGVVCAPLLVQLYAGGYRETPGRFEDTVLLVRIVFPYVFFMGSAALGMAALNANGRFAAAALTPALLNVALIAAPFALVPVMVPLGFPPIASLAIAALIGGALQVIAQWPALQRIDHLAMPRLALRDPVVRRAASLLLPLTVGLGVYQVNVMLARLFASYLPEGAQSYLYYGQRLVEIPQGMFALALASASLPRLSRLRAQGDTDALRETFVTGLRQALFVALPASALLVALAEPIVTVFFGRGAFERQSVIETSSSLLWQGAGVAFIALARVLVPVFYAHQDTRSPVWASAANLAAFSALAFVLRGPLGHVGIAMAISAAGLVQFVVLWMLLGARHPDVLPKEGDRGALLISALRLLLASALAGLAGWGMGQLGDWDAGGNDLRNVGVLIAASLAAGVSYLVACALLRAPELGEIRGALSRRRR